MGKFPYEDPDSRGWRGHGCTLEMLKQMAENFNFSVLVFQRGQLTWRYRPTNWKANGHMPVVALSVHGEHAFVHSGERSRELNKHAGEPRPVEWIRPVVLRPPECERADLDLEQVEPFSISRAQELMKPRVRGSHGDLQDPRGN